MDTHTIGRRVKFFRERAGKSQMDVELAIEASFGALSRLESGKVNPTKETIEKIAKYLGLTDRELYYIIGRTSFPATLEEISAATKQVESYFSQKGVLAYLLDDRARLICFSETFKRLFRINDKSIIDKLYFRTMPEIVINDGLYINRFIKGKNYYNTLDFLLRVYYADHAFMVDDPYYQTSLSFIRSDVKTRAIWKEITSNNLIPDVITYENQNISFSIFGKQLNLQYSREPLPKSRRFYIVQFRPVSHLGNLIAKFA